MVLDTIHTRPRRPARACIAIRVNHDGRGAVAIAHRAGELPHRLASVVANLTGGL